MAEINRQIKPYPLGAHREDGGIRVSFVSGKEACGVILYNKESGEVIRRILFQEEHRMGNIRYGWIADVDPESVAYQFYEEDCVIADVYGRTFIGQGKYGEKRNEKNLKAGFLENRYDWQKDKRPLIPYEDCVCYCMHVRGFTRHPSSGVKHKGTFRGVVEKLPYLKNLGITTVELQPVYEFLELEAAEEPVKGFPVGVPIKEKLNYWGYKKGYYYAPKAAYASGDDPVGEFRDMVSAFHTAQMEVVMQFYFPREFPRQEILDILRFWALEYHVDGFRLMGEGLPVRQIASDPGLADVKLWFDYMDEEIFQEWGQISRDEAGTYRHLAVYRDDYLNDMRRFLKGDNDMLQAVCYQMRRNPAGYGKINYFTNYCGFTMMDMVTYNDKHNEDNGENNQDGNHYNLSWNCGQEGPSRKKQVIELRKKQYKNAMSMLFLSQGTPLIFMGDEFGNSQMGNNNPYCHDNEVTWLDWKDLEKNQDLYEFTEAMIALRKKHPVLHPGREVRLTDHLAKGYPDLSYHGAEAWKPSMNCNDRQIGMMYCGGYAQADGGKDDDFLYLALNMHWEAKEFAMPRLPRGMKWELLYATEEFNREENKVPPRTVAVFISREMTENE